MVYLNVIRCIKVKEYHVVDMKFRSKLKLYHLNHILNLIQLLVISIISNDKSGYDDFKHYQTINGQTLNKSTINNQSTNIEELNTILEYLTTISPDSKFNLAIELIKILVTHKNKVVVASALGKLFFVFNNERIQSIMINELRTMTNNSNTDIRKSAKCSLELIAGDVYKLEILDLIGLLFSDLFSDLKYFFHSRFNSYVNSFTKNNQIADYFNSSLNYLFEETLLLSAVSPMNLIALVYYEEIENFDEIKGLPKDEYQGNLAFDNCAEYHSDIYSEIINVEHTKYDSLNSLTNIYSLTFLEKGHLRRLKALLDDEDYNVQIMGIDALIYAIESLIKLEQRNISS